MVLSALVIYEGKYPQTGMNVNDKKNSTSYEGSWPG